MKRIFCALCAFILLLVALPEARSAPVESVRLPVVMYHHISPKTKLWGDYVISPEELESDLQYLRDAGYTSVTVAELLDWCAGQCELPEKPMMVTFDDGYESTAAYAVPLLEKYGVTAVVGIIGSVAQQYTDAEDHMLDYSHMSWPQAAALEEHGVFELQCHTWDMHRLKPRKGCGPIAGESGECYAHSMEADTRRFQAAMEKYAGHRAQALVLPYGAYEASTMEMAGQLGFSAVLTCTEKVNELTGDPAELMEICRFNRPHGISSKAFFRKWAE